MDIYVKEVEVWKFMFVEGWSKYNDPLHVRVGIEQAV
jgi:hypothetical protein